MLNFYISFLKRNGYFPALFFCTNGNHPFCRQQGKFPNNLAKLSGTDANDKGSDYRMENEEPVLLPRTIEPIFTISYVKHVSCVTGLSAWISPQSFYGKVYVLASFSVLAIELREEPCVLLNSRGIDTKRQIHYNI